MVGKYQGNLIGYRSYEKDGKTVHMYQVFIGGKKDSATGLFNSDCMVANVKDDKELPNMKPNMLVEFYGEQKQGAKGQFWSFSDISAVEK